MIVEDWLIQPIAADTIADVMVEAALGQIHAPSTITCPDAIRLPELTSKLLAQQDDSRQVRVVEPAVVALGAGALLASGQAIVVGPDVETWLQTLAPPAPMATIARTATAPNLTLATAPNNDSVTIPLTIP